MNGEKVLTMHKIHETAIIAPGAELGPGVVVGPYSVIGDDTVLSVYKIGNFLV